MKNAPLVLLGVVFTIATAPFLSLLGGKALIAVFSGIALLSGVIDALILESRKNLNDILKLDGLTGKRLNEVAIKVGRWRAIFDSHFLLSMSLKVSLVLGAGFVAAFPSSVWIFYLMVWEMSVTFALIVLLIQSFNSSRHIRGFVDRKTVESRNLVLGREEAKLIKRDPVKSEQREEASPSAQGYQRIILKI